MRFFFYLTLACSIPVPAPAHRDGQTASRQLRCFAPASARAHELDPEDGDGLYRWAVLQPYPQNVAGLERHVLEYRSGAQRERRKHEYIAFLKALAGRKIWLPPAGADRAEMSYAQQSISRNLETEVSGFLGLPALNRARVTVNYRDGTLKIEE